MEAFEMKTEIKVGLLWHSLSSDNLGVGALTESQIAICNSAATKAGVAVKFVIVGTPGSRSQHGFGSAVSQGNPVSIRRTILNDAPYLDDLQRCDLVLDIGEGDSFTDIYGNYRFAFLWGSKFGLLRRRVPLVLSPQTIGPFKSPITRFLAGRAMRRCKHVFARDDLSAKYLEQMGVKGNTSEVIDVAFRLPFTRPEAARDGKVHVGVNVSGLLLNGGYTGNNQFGLSVDYPALVDRLLQHWTAMPDHVVWLVPHVLGGSVDKDNDLQPVDRLLSRHPTCRVAPHFASPSDAKSFISGLAFLTGARMHACIAAISSGVPVVPLSYSRKFNGLFNTLGYSWFADGLADNTDEAFRKITDGEANRAKLHQDAERARLIADARLQTYEDYLAKCFAESAAS
jgi:colanic acid/amylovoran biosynthesis protein